MVELKTCSILLFCILIYVEGKTSESDFFDQIAPEVGELRNETDIFWKDYSPEDVKAKQAEIMKNFIDSSVEPCESFFKYACGNGIKYNSFRDEDGNKSSIFTRYGKLMVNSAGAINLLNDQYKDIKDENSAEGKLKMFYSSCINEKENTTNVNPDLIRFFSRVPEIINNKCFEVTVRNLYPLLGAFFIKNSFDRKTDEVINKISTELVKTLVSDINQAQWIDSDAKKAILNYLNEVNVKSGIELFSDEVFDKIYADLKVTPNDYKANLVNIEQFNSNKRLIGYSFSDSLSYYYQGKEENNILNLPIFELQPPNFHRYFPKSLYGNVGTEIANKLITSFPEFELGDKVKELDTCLRNEMNSYGSEAYDFFRWDFGKSNADKVITEYFSIQKAYNTYEKWLENSDSSENEKLTGLDLNPKQLFFLNYAQNRCLWNKEKLDEAQNIYLTNFEKFAEVYSCPIGSGMNPEQKCKLTS